MPDSDLLHGIITYGVHKQGRLVSRSGAKLDWLIDLRAVFLRADCLRRVANAFWDLLGDGLPRQIAGVETAAVPLLTALLLSAPQSWNGVGGLIVRKERKATGLGNSIEGTVGEKPIILVDDILNSGSSAERARVVIEAAGGRMVELFVVVDFRSKKGLDWRTRHGIKVTSLFTLEDFGLSLRKVPPPLPQQFTLRWRRAVEGGNPFYVVPKSAPVLVGGRVYRGCDAARMDSFDAKTGDLVWSFEVRGAAGGKGIWSTPAIHDGRLYFGAYNGSTYCLDVETGREVWTESLGEWIGASPLVVPRHHLLYIGVEYERPWAKGSMAALDLQTGAKVWETRTKRYQHGSASYFVGSDLVIWGSADHETVAFDAATGEIAWRFPTRRSVKYAPAIDEERGLVAFASFDQSIYLLDAATGEFRGQWPTDGICYTTPLFAKGKLFCGSGDRRLYVIDIESGAVLKRIYAGSRIYASPVLVGDSVLFGTTGGKVFELDVHSLDIVGTFQLSDAVTNAVAPSVDGKTLYVSTTMNAMFCIERLKSEGT